MIGERISFTGTWYPTAESGLFVFVFEEV